MHASNQQWTQDYVQGIIQGSIQESNKGSNQHTFAENENNTDELNSLNADDSLFSNMNEEEAVANTSAKSSGAKTGEKKNDGHHTQPHSSHAQNHQEINYKFEDALSELEKIAQQLESGKLSLEDALKLYKHGVKLKDFCEKELKKAKEFVESFDEGGV